MTQFAAHELWWDASEAETLPDSGAEAYVSAPLPHAEADPTLSDEALLARLERNEIVPITNGYAFRPDQRPAGQEDVYIPATEFTAYFANRLVPYASTGANRRHDIQIHGPSYKRLFESHAFAEVVAGAAVSTGGDYDQCYAFTFDIDQFGDNHVLLTQLSDRFTTEESLFHVEKAKQYMRHLIARYCNNYLQLDEQQSAIQQFTLFSSTWVETGLHYLEESLDVLQQREATQTTL